MKKRLMPAVSAVALGAMCSSAYAVELDFSGFMSIAGGVTNAEKVRYVNPLTGRTTVERPKWNEKSNDFDFSEDSILALQASAEINDSLSFTAQMIADGRDDFDMNMAWAFLSYQPNENWLFRVGRLRTPIFFMSEYLDVAYTYNWIRPPDEVYGQVDIRSIEGVAATYYQEFDNWDYNITFVYGNTRPTLAFFNDDIRFKSDNIAGFDFVIGNENLRLRAGYSRTKFGLESLPNEVASLKAAVDNTCALLSQNGAAVTNTAGGSCTVTVNGLNFVVTPDTALGNKMKTEDIMGSFWGLGFSYEKDKFSLLGEYTQRDTDTLIIVNTASWYLSAAYRFGKITPHVTVSSVTTRDENQRELLSAADGARIIGGGIANNSNLLNAGGGASAQFHQAVNDALASLNYDNESVTVGVRWDIWDATALKLEYMYIHPKDGTFGLFSVPPSQDVSMLGVAIDVVF